MESDVKPPYIPVVPTKLPDVSDKPLIPLKVEKKSDLSVAVSVTFMVMVILLVTGIGILRFVYGYNFNFFGSESTAPGLTAVDQTITSGTSPEILGQVSPTEPINPTTTDSIVTTKQIDDKWISYSSSGNHFSINLPKKVIYSEGDCINGKFVDSLVPLVAFEASNSSIVTVSYFFENKRDSCKRFINTNALMRNRLVAQKDDPSIYIPIFWDIKTISLENQTDISGFIRSKYGINCNQGELKQVNETTFDVPIVGCTVNHLVVLKYSTSLKLLANWDGGSEVLFSGINHIPSYDSQIIESFRFTK